MGLREFKEKHAVILDRQQDAAVECVEGAVLLLAVPGSGKTTVLISRLGYMILEKEIRPEDILTVTYTTAAAADMRRRFMDKFGKAVSSEPDFRTINSFSQMILTHYARIVGKKVFEVADREKKRIIGQVFHEVTGDFGAVSEIEEIGRQITFVKNMCLTEAEIGSLDRDIEHFSEIYSRYNMEYRKRHWIDYDDQMVYALRILKICPDLLAYFRKRYRYICVDEAQDTSKIQHEIIRLLAGKQGNLFMVGDEDQSIYGFRAAYPEALISFEKNYEGGRVLLMETNYRSCPQIVSAADRLIRENHERHEKNMKAAGGTEGQVKEIRVRSRKAQYRYLLKAVRECETETAVLYRNNYSGLPFIDLLDRNHISFRMKMRDNAFFSSPVVRDIRDFIALALDPLNKESFLRIYYKMDAGISSAIAEKAVKNEKSKKPFLERISENAQISPYLRQRCRELNLHFFGMRGENAGRAVSRILNSMGYKKYMKQKGMDPGSAEIMRILGEQEEDISAFPGRLDYLEKLASEGSGDENSHIILSTIHSSKGLEYDRVYLADMIEGILPSEKKSFGISAAASSEKQYEEERRLYYVGMTRAKKELFIFTFVNDPTSRFSSTVFRSDGTQCRKKEPERKKTADSVKSSLSLKQKETETEDTVRKRMEDLVPGSSVVHNRFGKGVILAKSGKTAEIQFDSEAGTKKISLEIALKNRLLRPVV